MTLPRLRIAVAGFGPFPGVPKNPSGEIVRAITKLRRFPAAGVLLDTAILTTAYGEAERQLEILLAKSPDAVVLFGVAGRARHIRVETIARNRASLLHPDHARYTPATRKLDAAGATALKVRGPAIGIRNAIRNTGARAELSVDAGSYLCNAVFYRALTATAVQKPAPLTFFIHVPPADTGILSMNMMIRAGEAAVWAAANEAAKARIVPRRDG
ncbi:MAG: peptidase C15 [Xanthobacteraceae bacterium]|nr:peptidase C15 [Xanthobacteraceae bacterium]